MTRGRRRASAHMTFVTGTQRICGANCIMANSPHKQTLQRSGAYDPALGTDLQQVSPRPIQDSVAGSPLGADAIGRTRACRHDEKARGSSISRSTKFIGLWAFNINLRKWPLPCPLLSLAATAKKG